MARSATAFFSPRLLSFYPLFLLGWLFLFCGTTCVPAHNFQVSCGLYRADTCPTYASLLSRLLISRFREPFRDETRRVHRARPSKTIDSLPPICWKTFRRRETFLKKLLLLEQIFFLASNLRREFVPMMNKENILEQDETEIGRSIRHDDPNYGRRVWRKSEERGKSSFDRMLLKNAPYIYTYTKQHLVRAGYGISG